MRNAFAALLLFPGLISSACVHVPPLFLSEELLHTIWPLAVVPNVNSNAGCAELCLRERHCDAARYRSAEETCDLLRGPVVRWDGSGPVRGPIEVRTMPERQFGRCPASYSMWWGRSRYRLVNASVTWEHAAQLCRQDGAKLAELTSKAERAAVVSALFKNNSLALIGGKQDAHETRTFVGWRWYQSGLEINGLTWTDVNDAENKLNWVAAYVRNEKMMLLQISADSVGSFLCECLVLD